MDVVTLGQAAAAARKRYDRGQIRAAWMGDSLTGNGSFPTSVFGTIAASSVGATSLTFTSLAAARPAPTAPAVGNVIALEPGTASEEFARIAAVSGTGPYTLTVAATTYAHAAGSEVRTVARRFSAQSVPLWVSLLSSNAIKFGSLHAHGSYGAADIQQVYLPQVLKLSPKPGVCFVNVARNDIYTDASLVIYGQILDSLIAAGIRPVVTSAPPANAIGVTIPPTWNLKLARECRVRGIPFIDIYTPLVDTGSGIAGAGHYLTTFNADDTHPSEVGAKAWAQAIVSALAGWVDMRSDTIAAAHNSYNGDTASYPFNSNNALMLTDTNSDGIPDSWTKTQGNAGDTVSLVTEAGVAGKMLSITRAAAGATDPILVSNSFTIIPGHKYRAYLLIKTTGMDAAYTNQISTTGGAGGNTTSAFPGFDIRWTDSVALTDDALFSIRDWKRDIPLTASPITHDFTAPTGLTTNTIACAVRLRGSAASLAYTVEVRPWLVDLTAAGAA